MRLTHRNAAGRTAALTLAAALSLTACSSTTTDDETADAAVATEDDTSEDPETDEVESDADEEPTADVAAAPLPPMGQMAPTATYTSDQLGMRVEFATPRELFVALNAPGRLGMVSGFDPATGEYPPETGIALGFRRWAGWSTPEEAVDSSPGASIAPDDVDGWVEANDVLVLGDETREIAGRSVRVLDVTVDPDTEVAAASQGQGLCFEGWDPCFYIGDAAPAAEQKSDWISAVRTTRIYIVPVDGSEPLLVSVGAPPGDAWFDEVESTVIPSLTLGPDAPPLA